VAGVLLAAGTALLVVTLTRAGPPPAPPSASQRQAAAWTARQVSPGAVVACDPVMCGLLRQDGLPAARLKTLDAGTRDPLGSSVVIATATVRTQFGASLATVYAPQVIAGFGAGGQRVEVRAIAPDGAAAYRAALGAQHAELSAAGRDLLGNPTIRATPAARAALLAGRVDPRLLAILAVMSSQQNLRLQAFGDASPGASSLVPLRSVQLAGSAADRSAIRAFLAAQQGAYRPAAVTSARDSGGQPVVTVRFGAPDPLSIP
jgi:hypothetical protein